MESKISDWNVPPIALLIATLDETLRSSTEMLTFGLLNCPFRCGKICNGLASLNTCSTVTEEDDHVAPLTHSEDSIIFVRNATVGAKACIKKVKDLLILQHSR